jgi:hypothetical protein
LSGVAAEGLLCLSAISANDLLSRSLQEVLEDFRDSS